MADKNKYPIVEDKLYNYKSMKVQLNSYKIDLEYLNKEYIECRGKSYGDVRAKTNNFYSSVENELLTKEREIEELELKIRKTEMQIKKIENALNLLDYGELKLVEYRYFSNRTIAPSWIDVAEEIGFSDRKCRNMRNDIINKLENII